MSPHVSAAVVARNEAAPIWEAARYPREDDASVRRLGSLPRLAVALTGHGFRRLWARRSVR